MPVILSPERLLVVLETREEDGADVVHVVGVFGEDQGIPSPRPGWTRNVVRVFRDVIIMCSPAFRFHPKATTVAE